MKHRYRSIEGAVREIHKLKRQIKIRDSLIAKYSRHSRIARALACGVVRWEPFQGQEKFGEMCFSGMRITSKLDEYGVPEAHDIDLRRIDDAWMAKFLRLK